jgi:predicted kinase
MPGAGKTTLAKKLSEEMPGVRFCPDEWMQDLGVSLWDRPFRDNLEVRFWKLSQELLMRGQTVILEYGFWAKSERDEKLHDARALGVNIELHYLNIPTEELRTRLEKRGMEGDDVILAGKLDEYLKQFEPPSESELKQYDNHS